MKHYGLKKVILDLLFVSILVIAYIVIRNIYKGAVHIYPFVIGIILLYLIVCKIYMVKPNKKHWKYYLGTFIVICYLLFCVVSLPGYSYQAVKREIEDAFSLEAIEWIDSGETTTNLYYLGNWICPSAYYYQCKINGTYKDFFADPYNGEYLCISDLNGSSSSKSECTAELR